MYFFETSYLNVLNGLTGSVTITSPNSTLTISTSGQNVTTDINLANSNTWTAKQIINESVTGTAIQITESGTQTTNYGIKNTVSGAGTTNYGNWITVSGATNNWGYYANATANWFTGSLYLGTTNFYGNTQMLIIQPPTQTRTSGSYTGSLIETTSTPTSASTAAITNTQYLTQWTGTQNSNGATLLGLNCQTSLNNSASLTYLYSGEFFCLNQSTGTLTNGIGGYFANTNTSTGTTTNGYAGQFIVQVTGGGTITTGYGSKTLPTISGANSKMTTWYGYYSTNPTVSSGGALTNSYGLYIENITAGGTLNYAIYSAGGSIFIGGGITTYNNISTSGSGIVPVYKTYSTAGLSALVSNAINYTPPASAGTYRISVMVNVHTAAAVNMAVTVAFKDAGGNSQSNVMVLSLQGSTTIVNNMNNTSGIFTGDYIFSIDNSQTAITLSTTGTTMTAYDMAASLEQLI